MCSDLGRPANHRAGNKACTSAQTKGRVRPAGDVAVGQIIGKNINLPSRDPPLNETEVAGNESSKPQRKKRPTLRNVGCEDMEIDATLKTQEDRDRDLRTTKTRKKASERGKRRSDENEEEVDKTCEPEDSGHDSARK